MKKSASFIYIHRRTVKLFLSYFVCRHADTPHTSAVLYENFVGAAPSVCVYQYWNTT